ncbi:membrane-bound lytic murein transglycosylase MltF [Thermodesulfobacteriota bacterium]
MISTRQNRFHGFFSDGTKILGIWLFISCCFLCGCDKPEKHSPANHVTLQKIFIENEITVITRNNTQCYYIYRDQEMGFEYDLAKAFADYLGVNLKIHVAEKWEGMIPALMDGTGALIAASFTITPKRRKRVNFSHGYMAVQQHIIVHRNNRKIKFAQDLAGETVHVRRGTSYQERLEGLQSRGIGLRLVSLEDLPTEELIRQVAEGKIGATIADSNIAFRTRRYYPQAVVAGPISEKEYLGWAVHPDACELLEKINLFFKAIEDDGTFARIHDRYYRHVELFDYLDLRKFHRRLQTRLPKYEHIIRDAAERHGFDWRLIAAQIYKESHFNPVAESHAGAHGLMQLTPATARSLGVTKILNPEQNIRAGVQYLGNLYDHYMEASGVDRLFIALAAYNVGMGHVWDARNLARKMGFDPNEWSSLKKTLPLLKDRQYYGPSKYGYCRGTEPIDYIKHIVIYYDILKYLDIQYDI